MAALEGYGFACHRPFFRLGVPTFIGYSNDIGSVGSDDIFGYMVEIDDAQCCGVTMFIPFEKYARSSWAFNEKYLKTSWAKAVWIE